MVAPRHDAVIIGAGIVGLATALSALRRRPGLRLAVLDKEVTAGAHQTGHNSGVIHSGVYYRPGSLKARNCVAGAAEMKRFCEERGIAWRQCGKHIVATSERQRGGLAELKRRGEANGVSGLELIDASELARREPNVAGVEALWVPATAITDFGRVAREMATMVREAGGRLGLGENVTGILRSKDLTIVEAGGTEYTTRIVVNCAGLQSDRVARLAGVRPRIRIVPFRGDYHRLSARRAGLVHSLIYPVPDPDLPFLGAHFTLKLDGSIEVGPTAVLALKREGYRPGQISATDMAGMLASAGFWRMAARHWRTGLSEQIRTFSRGALLGDLRRLVPGLEPGDLEPSGSGVRAQAVDPQGGLLDDFEIVSRERIIHVLNVPSPAATASLAIGGQIAAMMEEVADLV